MALISVNKLAEDTEEMALAETLVKEWFDELKDGVYNARDILDDIATKAIQRKLDAEFEGLVRKVPNSIANSLCPCAQKIDPKIKQVLHILENLEKHKDVLGLKEGGGGKPSERLVTTLVEEFNIFGRDDDKEKIINLFMSDGTSGIEKMEVIPIVGMGGIGKNTFAQFIYNDKRMKEG